MVEFWIALGVFTAGMLLIISGTLTKNNWGINLPMFLVRSATVASSDSIAEVAPPN